MMGKMHLPSGVLRLHWLCPASSTDRWWQSPFAARCSTDGSSGASCSARSCSSTGSVPTAQRQKRKEEFGPRNRREITYESSATASKAVPNQSFLNTGQGYPYWSSAACGRAVRRTPPHLLGAQSAIFSLLLVCFEIIEEVIVGLIHGKSLVASVPQFGGGGLEGKLIVGLLAFVSLVPFFLFTEVQRVLGTENCANSSFRTGRRPTQRREALKRAGL